MLFDDSVKETIYHIIKDNMDVHEQINLEVSFEDIGIGSISFIKIMAMIEIYYDFEIEEKYYINVQYKNVRDFIDKISERIHMHYGLLENNL